MKAYRVKIEFYNETKAITSHTFCTPEHSLMLCITEKYKNYLCASVIIDKGYDTLDEEEDDDREDYELIKNSIFSLIKDEKMYIKTIKVHRMKLEKFKMSLFKFLVCAGGVSSDPPKNYNDVIDRINKSNHHIAFEYNTYFSRIENLFKEPEGYAHTKFKIIYTGNHDTINPDIEIPEEALLNKELIENLELIEKSYKTINL